MILDSTGKSFRAFLAGAPATTQPVFVVDYVDVTTTTFTPIAADGALNGVTAVTLVAAPAAATQRQVKSLSIHNKDTAPVVVTVELLNGATQRTIVKATLAADDQLLYEQGSGWKVGLVTAGGSGAPTTSSYVVLALDATLTAERTLAAEASVLTLTDGGAGGAATLGVATNGIGNTKFRQGAATSVVGRSAGSTGNVADIAASADDQLLVRRAGALTWGALVAGDIPNLSASKITTGLVDPARLPGLGPNYYAAHVNLAGGLDLWYLLGATGTDTLSTLAVTANLLYAYPFVAAARGPTIDRLAFSVSTLLAGNGRVGIYDATSDSNLYPNALVLDGGGISTATTGVKSATVSQALTAGKLYWAVYLGDAAPTVRCHTAGTQWHFLGLDSGLTGAPVRAITVAQAYGALPGTFPAGAGTINTNPPNVYVRYSA